MSLLSFLSLTDIPLVFVSLSPYSLQTLFSLLSNGKIMLPLVFSHLLPLALILLSNTCPLSSFSTILSPLILSDALISLNFVLWICLHTSYFAPAISFFHNHHLWLPFITPLSKLPGSSDSCLSFSSSLSLSC